MSSCVRDAENIALPHDVGSISKNMFFLLPLSIQLLKIVFVGQHHQRLPLEKHCRAFNMSEVVIRRSSF